MIRRFPTYEPRHRDSVTTLLTTRARFVVRRHGLRWDVVDRNESLRGYPNRSYATKALARQARRSLMVLYRPHHRVARH